MSGETRQQYRRRCSLIVAGESGDGIDLSKLRIVFSVKKEDAETPNAATVKVYNMALETAKRIKGEYSRVILQAGYESNFGTIFDGNIINLKFGREGDADTYVEIEAGDGDEAYNYAVVSTTLAAGSTPQQQMGVCAASMAKMGVQRGYIGGDMAAQRLPRGRVMYGNARDFLRSAAKTTGTTWSVQDGRLQVVPLGGLLPGQAVRLNSRTGLIGAPEIDIDGMRCRCLLNPLLQIGGMVQIDEASIATETSWQQIAGGDGVYRLLTVEHSGDTCGNEWSSSLTCLDVNDSAPEGKQVKT